MKVWHRDIRNLLVESFDDNDIPEDEFLLLYDANTLKNPDFPYDCYGSLDLNEMDNSKCLAEFCFHKNDVPVLLEALQLPQSFTCHQGTTCDGIEALCIILRRFAYPCRYSNLIPRFGRPVPELSMISNLVMDTVYQERNHRLPQWNNTLLNPPLLESYAHGIDSKGSPLPNCFGFIDGTVRPICQPEQNQRIIYNGHKRVHGLKYQFVILPNGMIANRYGPVGNCFNLICCFSFSFLGGGDLEALYPNFTKLKYSL